MKVAQFGYSQAEGWSDFPDHRALDSSSTLVLVFCAPEFREHVEPLQELQRRFPNSIVTGCSTAGEIFGDQIKDHSLSVAVLRFETSRIRAAWAQLATASQSKAVGAALAQQLLAPDLKGVLVLSDGLLANGSALAEGLSSVIDTTKVSVSGGLAGDGGDFKSTWILNQGQPCQGEVIAIGLYGPNLVFSTSSRGGWDIFGPERVITKSKGNVLYEIDDRPCLDLYKEYLGEKAKDLPAAGLLFPLQIRSNSAATKRLVRTILACDEREKTVTFAGDTPQGHLAQLMRANFERVIDGAAEAAVVVKTNQMKFLKNETGIQGDALTLAISCVGRRLALAARAEEETEALKVALGSNAKIVGFYSYGELAPFVQGGPCDLHNQSMTVTNIVEKKSQVDRKAA